MGRRETEKRFNGEDADTLNKTHELTRWQLNLKVVESFEQGVTVA